MISPPFEAHVDLLRFFLARRAEIVERIQGVLNAQRQPAGYLQDGPLLSQHFEECFFAVQGVTPDQAGLRGQLDAARRASGFNPRPIPALYNDLVDPAELMMRAFHLWRQTRWPGRNGRVHYAHTLFNVHVLRSLELLSLRLWDDGTTGAGGRLSRLQGVVDGLWHGSPPDQPVLVRDARWLILLAQSPATDDLGVYFDVARQIADTLPDQDRMAIHRAAVRMAGGHLRSQIRYHATKRGVGLDEAGVILTTRTTNALDFALLIQDLVPLLEAYEHAWQRGDVEGRLALADAICQGISPDPELFVSRVDLLGAYSMIEHLFIAAGGDGRAAYTPMGGRHVRLVEQYRDRIARVVKPLADDCPRFRPLAGACSPYGVIYGFSTNLVEHMAFKAVQPDAVTAFGLEDVFAGGGADKLAWVSGWRKLPHLSPAVQALFDYPQPFAEAMFDRLERALRARASGGAPAPTGRLFVRAENDPDTDPATASVPDLPVRYVVSSDPQIVTAGRAEAYDEAQLLADRREAKCLLSYRTPGGWVAVTKAALTEVLGAGHDARVAVPAVAADVLRLMCPGKGLASAPGSDIVARDQR